MAMEEGKSLKAENKQDFNKFLESYVSEGNQDATTEEVENAQEDETDEAPEILNDNIRARIREHFEEQIKQKKKLRVAEVKPFLDELSEDFPEKSLNWKTVMNYAWGLVQNEKKREKKLTPKKEPKKESKKSCSKKSKKE